MYAFRMRASFVGLLFGGAVSAVLAACPAACTGQAPGSASPSAPAAPSAPASSSASAAQPHFPTSEDLRHLKAIATPLLSPDGARVLFAVTESTADGGATHLWLASTKDIKEPARQITFSPPSDKRGERGAQWSPDGAAIYFLAKRGEHTQLFRLDLRGGEASPYDMKVLPAVDESKIPGAIPPPGAEKKTEKPGEEKSDKKEDKKAASAPEPLPLEIGGFAPSPDGKWLAVWGRDPETPGEKKQQDAKADAFWYDHDLHGTRLYLAALQADGSIDGALKPVAVEPDVRAAVWSPAGDRLLATTEKPNGASDLGPAGAAWLVQASSPDKPLKVDGIPATMGRGLAWRPDGREIVFAAKTPDDAPPGYDELFALKMPASGVGNDSPRSLTAGFAGQLNGSVLFYQGDHSLVSEAGIGTHSTPAAIALDGKTAVRVADFGTPLVRRPQHQPQANRLGMARRTGRATGEALLRRSFRRALPGPSNPRDRPRQPALGQAPACSLEERRLHHRWPPLPPS